MTVKKLLPFLLVTASLSLMGCDALDYLGKEKKKPPLPGERVAVLDFEKDLRPDADAQPEAFEAASEVANDSWPQAGGNPDHNMENLALPKTLKRAWSSSIGDGSRSKIPLTAQPVVAGQSIFTLDTDSKLSAFDTASGKRRWKINIRPKDEDDPVISGGVAYDNGIVYVTGGYDEIVAVDAQTGDIKWRASMNSPSRAAPTVLDGHIYVTTLNNTLLALDPADGKVQWEYAGLDQSTGLVGGASAAATSDLVVPAFSSGELYGLRPTNGSVAWSDNLSGSLRLGGMGGLSDIRGLPVVADGVVYAISIGGKMVAVNMRSGNRVWQKDISGSKTPLVSGNRVFLVSADAQIIALAKDSGDVIWVSQLARWKNKEDRTGPILWSGPIMAGGRLIALSSDGRLAEINPNDGTLIDQLSSGKDIRIAPVVAGGTLYLVSEDGDLSAWR